jgi:prevent-host-death family protein
MVNFAENIKPLSYMETHTAEVVEQVRNNDSPFVVTQDGEAAAVLIGVRQYQTLINAVNLLKILAIGAHDIKAGRWISQTALDAKVQALLEA